MKLIKLKDELGTIIDVESVEHLCAEYIKGSNPYYIIKVGFKSGNFKELRYNLVNREKYEEDIKYFNGFVSRR